MNTIEEYALSPSRKIRSQGWHDYRMYMKWICWKGFQCYKQSQILCGYPLNLPQNGTFGHDLEDIGREIWSH